MSSQQQQHSAVVEPGSLQARHRFLVQPLVVFSVLDHFKRRGKKQERVIGTLLGIRKGNAVHIQNCFAIPHMDRDNEIMVDMEYHQAMFDLHKRVSSNEIILGWYTSGGKDALISNSSRLHEIYQDVCENPIVLAVDTTLKNSRLEINVFTTSFVQSPDEEDSRVSIFREADHELELCDEDRIGVDALIQSTPDDDSFDSPASLLPSSRALSSTLENVHNMLADMCDYVEGLASSASSPDPELGRTIANLVSSVPDFDTKILESTVSNSISDFVSLSYLTALTKAHVALADKINLVA